MMSERQYSILETYQKNDRYISQSFIDSIEWNKIPKFPLPERLFPVLKYMRDIEAFTNIYFEQLLRTPTGRDPIIRQFMDRWLIEEETHAQLLNRFLNEAGIDTPDDWYRQERGRISKQYFKAQKMNHRLTKLFGKRFGAVHMTWGAINELSTLQGYKRLWEVAEHPILEKLLRGIAREESSHIFFYYNVARLKLEESKFSRQMTRYIIEKFWRPVGAGIKAEPDCNYIVRALFSGPEALEAIEANINRSIMRLPGFAGTSVVTDRIAEVTQQPNIFKMSALQA